MSKRERIFQVVQRISVLKVELERLEKEFVALVPDDESAAVKEEPSAPSKVLAHFSKHREQTFDAQELAKELKVDLHLMRSTLFRLARDKKIRKAKRGQYGALSGGGQEAAA